MRALAFWKAVIQDRSDFLETLISTLEESGIRYCVIGGAAVNAYVEPLVTLDLDIAVAAESSEALERTLGERFDVKRFPHSLNVAAAGSDLRVQVQTDPRYSAFVERATRRPVLGLTLPVADIEDLLQGKIWAATDPDRRPGKRGKDLLDIRRLTDAYPDLRGRIPQEILERLRLMD